MWPLTCLRHGVLGSATRQDSCCSRTIELGWRAWHQFMHKANRVWGGCGSVVKQVLRCRRVGLRAPVYVLVFACGVLLQGLFVLLSLRGCVHCAYVAPCVCPGLVRLLNVGFYAACCVFFVSAEVEMLLGLRRVGAPRVKSVSSHNKGTCHSF